jgi:dTDP-glucose pyrophosphorylase
MNIVVLLAGDSKDFQDRGYVYPKYLFEINNETLVQKVLNSLIPLHGKLHLIIRKEDNDKFYFGQTLRILAPNASIITVENSTKGAVCTALFAIEHINTEEELLVINGDQLIKTPLLDAIESFKKRYLDGGIVAFSSIHPRWSYVLTDSAGFVVQTSEKKPISNQATAGCYYYKKGNAFIEACIRVIKKDVCTNGLYYISSTYNELILQQKKIGVFDISRQDYLSFATYQMYENALMHLQEV